MNCDKKTCQTSCNLRHKQLLICAQNMEFIKKGKSLASVRFANELYEIIFTLMYLLQLEHSPH